MNYFLDSNVIVSHIFSWDSLNIIANDFISSENYFCSDNVIKEVENVFNEKCQEYDYFLLMLCRLFENFSDNNFIYFYDVYRFLNRVNPKSKFDIEDMRQALRIIWEKLGFNEYHDAFDVKNKFSLFQNDFQSIQNKNKQKTFNYLKIVSNHTIKDKDIINMIEKEKLRDYLLHGSDENILFDANEFCKNKPELNLKFVSADQDFLKAINILMEYLCIGDCINLLEFKQNN